MFGVIPSLGSYLVIKITNRVRNLIRNGLVITFGATNIGDFSTEKPH